MGTHIDDVAGVLTYDDLRGVILPRPPARTLIGAFSMWTAAICRT